MCACWCVVNEKLALERGKAVLFSAAYGPQMHVVLGLPVCESACERWVLYLKLYLNDVSEAVPKYSYS